MTQQYAFDLAFFDAGLKPAFAGTTLTVQLEISNIDLTCTVGALTGPAFDLILLTGQNNAGNWWLGGGTGELHVDDADIVPTAQPLGQAPRALVGSIQVNSTRYFLMGLLKGATIDAAGATAGARGPGPAAAAAAGLAGSDDGRSYDSELRFYDMSFQPTPGRARLTGKGAMVAVSPVSREWRVQGDLAVDGKTIPYLGWGSMASWYARASDSSESLSFLAATDVLTPGNNPIGTISYQGTSSFFIGQPPGA